MPANQVSKFYRNLHFINLSFPSRTQSDGTGVRKRMVFLTFVHC